VLGDIDREITNEKGEKGILEIKTGSEYSIEKWEGENIPDAYMIQLQWYLFLTGYKYGYFAALLGGHRYIEKYVQRDDELIKSLFQIAEDFWFNNIGKKVPPAADGSEASAKALEILHPQAVYTGGLELPPEIELLVIEREDAKVKLKELENLIDEKDNKIKEYMGDYAEAVTSDYIVKWGNKKGAERFDTKRFKAEHPEIAKDYIVIGEPSRSFSIKKKK
jgi:predicted phage-related endonuclease